MAEAAMKLMIGTRRARAKCSMLFLESEYGYTLGCAFIFNEKVFIF